MPPAKTWAAMPTSRTASDSRTDKRVYKPKPRSEVNTRMLVLVLLWAKTTVLRLLMKHRLLSGTTLKMRMVITI